MRRTWPSYHTTVSVRNPNVGPITLNVRYIQSNNGTAPTGERSVSGRLRLPPVSRRRSTSVRSAA
jgi:hypothetical protein